MTRPGAPALRLRIVLALFFLSGATGLLYQVVWVRYFVHVFGATVLAVSTVLAAFMAGLALGGLAGGRLCTRIRNPLRAYGLLETVLALYAGFVPFLLDAVRPLYAAVYPALADSFGLLSAVRFVVGVLILMPPTFLMGATLPLLTAHAEDAAGPEDRSWTRRRVAHLYATNTFGAVAGTAFAGLLLLPALGLQRTLFLGVGVNVLVGLAALALAQGQARRPSSPPAEEEARPARESRIPRPVLLLGAGVLGFSALALEVLWTRTLTLSLGTTTYAFVLVLMAFLVGIAGGSALAARFLRDVRRATGLFVAAPAAIGLLALSTLPVYDRLPALFVRLTATGSGTWAEALAVMFVLAALPMLAPTLISGAAFPLAVGIDRASGGAGRSVGDVYAANTLGAIGGSWIAGFVLIPELGLREGIVLAAGAQIVMTVGLLLARSPRRVRALVAAGGVVAVGAGLVAVLPDWDRTALTRGGFASAIELRRLGLTELAPDESEIVFLEEGVTTTVTVRRWADEFTMQMNGVTEASTRGDLSTEILLGALPTLLHEEPRDVLVIGLGSGITASTVIRHPGIRTVECAEISEAVVHGARFFEEANGGVLRDPRFRLVIGDGRNHLALSGRTFDVIVSHPSNLWGAGVGALLTREFFGLCRERLRAGGILCSWIQGYALSPEALRCVLAALREHFPQVSVWSAGWGDLLIVAGGEGFAVDVERLREKAKDPEARRLLAESDVPDLGSLVSRNLLAAEHTNAYIARFPANTDDNLLLEFLAPKLLYRDTIRELFESLHRAAGGTEDVLRNAPEALVAELPKLRRARELESRGRLLFRESRGEEGLAFVEEAHRLFPSDPAIADVLARALNGRGETLARRQDGPGALLHYRRAAEVDPDYGEPLANLARLYRGSAQLAGALAALEEAIRREPRTPSFLALRSEIRADMRDLDGARADAEAAVRIHPASEDGLAALGSVLGRLGEFDRAESVYAAGIARHPDSERLRDGREQLLRLRRKAEAAPATPGKS